jgi:hypothetical protein
MTLCAGLVLGLVSGVSQAADQPAQTVESGSWYATVEWPDDGNPYESRNFTVYSDAAGLEARQAVAEIGEDMLAELTAELGIVGDEMFRFPPGQDKLHIYVYKNQFPQAWGGCAYYGGLVIWSLDHEKRPSDLDNYSSVIKHELVHVLEFLLKGGSPADVPVEGMVQEWFQEGFAEAVTDGNSGAVITNLDYLNHLTSKYGRFSPVSFKRQAQVDSWSEKRDAMAGFHYLYPMYQLAVESLIDARGLGESPRDLVGIFTDMEAGSDFPTAFENRVGISLTDYEEKFFDLMHDYLPAGNVVFLRGISLTWLVLVAGSLTVLAWRFAGGAESRWGLVLIWLLVTVIFGPFGLLGYLLLYGSIPARRPPLPSCRDPLDDPGSDRVARLARANVRKDVVVFPGSGDFAVLGGTFVGSHDRVLDRLPLQPMDGSPGFRHPARMGDSKKMSPCGDSRGMNEATSTRSTCCRSSI